MKKLILLILVCSCSIVFGSEGVITRLTCVLQESVVDSTLSSKEAKYTFTFKGIVEKKKSYNFVYSIDGVQFEKELPYTATLEIKTTPGEHTFKFFYSKRYFEVTLENLAIKSKHHDTYFVHLEDSEFPVIMDKPIIYLYPQKPMQVELGLRIFGKPTFIYPPFNNGLNVEYTTKDGMWGNSPDTKTLRPVFNNGWSVVANPSGEILVDNRQFNYLFWEAELTYKARREELHSGFVVKSENTIAFLEDKLSQAGLLPKEQADFITYWGPKLKANSTNFIHFLFNEECDQFASINVTPTPSNINRVYIIWSAVEDDFHLTESQTIPKMNRDGFTIIEWGGTEIKMNINL